MIPITSVKYFKTVSGLKTSRGHVWRQPRDSSSQIKVRFKHATKKKKAADAARTVRERVRNAIQAIFCSRIQNHAKPQSKII